MFAHVAGDTIRAVVAVLPPLANSDDWVEVVPGVRPADDDTYIHDRTIELVDGIPTVVWTPHPRTDIEVEERRRHSNWVQIDAAINAALDELQQIIDAPPVVAVPDGVLTLVQLSAGMRQLRDAVQDNRAGIQRIATTLRQTIRLVRSDFNATD